MTDEQATLPPTLLEQPPHAFGSRFSAALSADASDNDLAAAWYVLRRHRLFQPDRIAGYTDVIEGDRRTIELFTRPDWEQ